MRRNMRATRGELKDCVDKFNQAGGGTVQPVAEGGSLLHGRGWRKGFRDTDGGKVFG